MPGVFAQFEPYVDLLDRSSHKSPISNFTETLPVGAALITTDGRKDITKLNGAFRDHANAPLKEYHCQAKTQDIILIHILLPAQIRDIICSQISRLVRRQMETSFTRNHPKRSIRLRSASTVLQKGRLFFRDRRQLTLQIIHKVGTVVFMEMTLKNVLWCVTPCSLGASEKRVTYPEDRLRSTNFYQTTRNHTPVDNYLLFIGNIWSGIGSYS